MSEAVREANRRRAGCARCGGARVRFIEGKDSDQGRFPGIVYKVCDACGHEVVTRRRPESAAR